MTAIDDPLRVRVSVDEIARDLAAYLRRVEAGEVVLVVVRAGKPVAEIKRVVSTPATLRPFGLCAGEFSVPDDFDEPLPGDIVRDWKG